MLFYDGKIWQDAEKGDPHVYVFVVLLICTSARHMAILDLTWDRVDFVQRTITYDENKAVDPMSKKWQKGRATVPMPRLAYDALTVAHSGRQSDHVVEHGGKRLKSARASHNPPFGGNAAARGRLGKRPRRARAWSHRRQNYRHGLYTHRHRVHS